jgi:hypothetical protein
MNIHDLKLTMPRMPIVPKDHNLADEFHRRLINWINDFHKSLDNEHEVGAQLVNFGQTVTFHINEQGETIKLVQHVSQISILLVAMKRNNATKPKNPIGFVSWEDYEKQKE